MMNRADIDIPSDEDFARAEKRQAEMSQAFSRIRETVLQEFNGHAPLHDIWLFPDRTTNFRAHVFYRSDSDIATSKDNGSENSIREALVREFRAWNGSSCAVEFDSHENVLKKDNGNYYKHFK
jgi:hypothetical protein